MKVSILSPVFNEAKYIAEMIDSVRCQTHSDFELLIVDDGSTDETASIVDYYASLDSRVVKVGGSSKLGKVAAFNLAFSQGTGDFFVLLGGDDVLPITSIEQRLQALGEVLDPDSRTAAFFRLRTFSEQRKFNNIVVPKSGRSNHSGGTMLMSRGLAEIVFPIDPSLVSEDIWTAAVSVQFAEHIIESEAIVLRYRIHPGNSNPRNLGFAQMNDSLYKRFSVYDRILTTDRFETNGPDRQNYQTLAKLEQLRFEGRHLAILRIDGVSVVSKLRTLSMSSPILYWLRSVFYRFFSGWS